MSTDPDRALDRLLKAELRGHADLSSPASASCIDAETLAAWADGALSSDEAQLVETHLADCARCQALMAAFARTETAPAAVVVPFRPKSVPRWLVPLAAGTVAATLLVWVAWPSRPEAPPATQMAADTKALGNQPTPPPPAPPAAMAEAAPAPKETSLAKKDEPAPKRQQAERRADAQPKTEPAGQVLGQQGQAGGATSASKAVATPPPPPPAMATPPAQPPVATNTAAAPPTSARDSTVSGLPRSEAIGGTASVIAEFSSPDPALAQPAAGMGRGGGGGGRGGAAGAGGRAATSAVFRAAVAIRWRVLSSGAVERSIDSGVTWQPVTIDPPTIRVTNGSAPSPTVCWLVARDGAVLLTTDGTNFARVTPPAPVDLASIVATSPRDATVRTADGRTFVTTDGGLTWTVRVP